MSANETFPLHLLPLIKRRKFRTTKILRGEGEGTHQTTQRGFGIEFSEYRAYEPGDNPKHIDWNHYAKSDKLYIKLFHEEKALSILVLVDSSSSMLNDTTKWMYVKNLTLVLSAIAITSGERISISILQGHPLINLTKLGQLKKVTDLFTYAEGLQDHDFLEALIFAQKKTRSPSQAILISDFLQPPSSFEPLLDALQVTNVALTGIQISGPTDLAPLGAETSSEVVDAETGERIFLSLDTNQINEYHKLLAEHSQSVKEMFYNRRAKFFPIETSQNISEVINRDFRLGGLMS